MRKIIPLTKSINLHFKLCKIRANNLTTPLTRSDDKVKIALYIADVKMNEVVILRSLFSMSYVKYKG